jgi:invasion protein IalB
LLRIDARDPIPAVAKVVDVHGIVIPLENSDPVLDALRQGKVLTITAETAKVSFKLTGTKDAIAALAACVTEHRETEKVKRLNGGRTTSRYRRA